MFPALEAKETLRHVSDVSAALRVQFECKCRVPQQEACHQPVNHPQPTNPPTHPPTCRCLTPTSWTTTHALTHPASSHAILLVCVQVSHAYTLDHQEEEQYFEELSAVRCPVCLGFLVNAD